MPLWISGIEEKKKSTLILFLRYWNLKPHSVSEVESLRTSLASRTQFEVLGLGLEASNPRKSPCLRLEDSTIFWTLKISLENAKNLAICEDLFCIPLLEIAWKKILKTFFFWRSPERIFWRPFFWRKLAPVSLVLGLGLEHSCSWPREGLSSEGPSLASDFFCVLGLGLEPCVLDSTSAQCFFLEPPAY